MRVFISILLISCLVSLASPSFGQSKTPGHPRISSITIAPDSPAVNDIVGIDVDATLDTSKGSASKGCYMYVYIEENVNYGQPGTTGNSAWSTVKSDHKWVQVTAAKDVTVHFSFTPTDAADYRAVVKLFENKEEQPPASGISYQVTYDSDSKAFTVKAASSSSGSQ